MTTEAGYCHNYILLRRRYSFTNSKNVTVRVIDYGCVITDILVPDKDGNVDDISIGYDCIEGKGEY